MCSLSACSVREHCQVNRLRNCVLSLAYFFMWTAYRMCFLAGSSQWGPCRTPWSVSLRRGWASSGYRRNARNTPPYFLLRLKCFFLCFFPSTAKTQYRKFETNIPSKGTVRLQSQFLHSCFCERFKYSSDSDSAAGKKGGPNVGLNRSLTNIECENWDWGRAIPFLGIYKFKLLCSELCTDLATVQLESFMTENSFSIWYCSEFCEIVVLLCYIVFSFLRKMLSF